MIKEAKSKGKISTNADTQTATNKVTNNNINIIGLIFKTGMGKTMFQDAPKTDFKAMLKVGIS